jgi:RHS repeat-associated protein
MDELYSYDEMNQIKSLNRGTLTTDNSVIANGNHAETWNFDETGNWLQYNRNGSIENRIHNTANEILNTVTHDKNGNMTIMPSLQTPGSLLSATYDAWNRIVSVANIADYRYDGRNHRIIKNVAGTETLSFFNWNWQELESVTDNQVTTYIWGLRYIDDLVLRENEEVRLYSLADPNWNVVALCNAVGNVVERYNYNAFGKRNVFDANFGTKIVSDFNWNRAFTGQVLDRETGMMLYRNRYYHVGVGRFATREPIGFYGDDVNFFRYVFNASIIMVDTLGLKKSYPIGPTTKPTTKPTTTMPKRWPIRLPPTTTKCIPMAGGCGVSDGPFPIGDIIGGGIIVCALIYDIYICTRPDPAPDPVPNPAPDTPYSPDDDDDCPETCATKYPDLSECVPGNYKFEDKKAADQYLDQRFGRNKNPGPETTTHNSSCPGGIHQNVYDWNGELLATVICCPCCEEMFWEVNKKMPCNIQ